MSKQVALGTDGGIDQAKKSLDSLASNLKSDAKEIADKVSETKKLASASTGDAKKALENATKIYLEAAKVVATTNQATAALMSRFKNAIPKPLKTRARI